MCKNNREGKFCKDCSYWEPIDWLKTIYLGKELFYGSCRFDNKYVKGKIENNGACENFKNR